MDCKLLVMVPVAILDIIVVTILRNAQSPHIDHHSSLTVMNAVFIRFRVWGFVGCGRCCMHMGFPRNGGVYTSCPAK